ALAVRMLRQAGASIVGVNCSVGPQPTLELLEEVLRAAEDTPVSAMPNAGLPQYVGGRFVYLASPEYFAEFAAPAVGMGVKIVGGCGGPPPAHVRAMRERLATHLPPEKLAPGAEVRVLEPPLAPVATEEREEPVLLRMLRERFVV